jgi:uncharacterized phage protein (TIGR01671 family)
MNREIKFRAWSNNEMVYFHPFWLNFTDGFWSEKSDVENYRLQADRIADNIGGYNHDDFNRDVEFVLMQFTGLKDSAGREIYEGDIVRVDCSEIGGAYNDGVYKVTYLLPDCAFFLEQLDQLNAIAFNECYQYEVIGNVYENPELLAK